MSTELRAVLLEHKDEREMTSQCYSSQKDESNSAVPKLITTSGAVTKNVETSEKLERNTLMFSKGLYAQQANKPYQK